MRILTIGLDFVRKVDKNWKKHVQSLDRINEEINNSEIKIFKKFDDESKLINLNGEKSDWDYWDFWKKNIH